MAIKELSEQLANQIAAGEVIERPSSVVKELVENAIDAHSQTIKVYLEEAGLKSIKVIDDGDGILPHELKTAFLRHATSKIASSRDLFHIHTLGFRGEALPSIASIAKVKLTSAVAGATEGREIIMEGGTCISEKPASGRQGTIVEVSDLFYNTPARLKHLKTMTTEYSHCLRLMQTFAQSHPEIRFQLFHNGRKEFETYGTNQADQVLYSLYKNEVRHQLFSINNVDDDFKIHGFLSLPTLTRASNHYLTLILNGRAIRNIALRQAIIQGYGSKLMTGRYPLGVVYIEMDPTLVDVNVHPTKQEVRLSKEESLCRLMTATIASALSEHCLIPEVSLTQNSKEIQQEGSSNIDSTTKVSSMMEQTKLSLKEALHQFDGVSSGVILEKEDVENTLVSKDNAISTGDMVSEDVNILPENTTDLTENIEQKDNDVFPEMEYFGQMHGTYLFAQNEEGLYIIDQHAAQERIKYEHYRVVIGHVSDDMQQLLMPQIFNFSPADAKLIEEREAVLQSVGLYLEPFGKNSYALRAHPSWMGDDSESVARDLIDYVLEDKSVTVASFRKEAAIMMSCKRSIKANHYLSEQQARQLLNDLSHCQNPYNCPHGRPVMVKMTNYEIERLFKRIQDPH